jgi:hypothetical protein
MKKLLRFSLYITDLVQTKVRQRFLKIVCQKATNFFYVGTLSM